MEILKTTTQDGYRLEVLCVFDDCAWAGDIDPQQPVWAVAVALDEHLAQRHQTDPAVLQARQGRHRRVENVQLPLVPIDRLEDLDS